MGKIERRRIQRYEALANQGSREKQSRDAAKRPAILMIQGHGDSGWPAGSIQKRAGAAMPVVVAVAVFERQRGPEAERGNRSCSWEEGAFGLLSTTRWTPGCLFLERDRISFWCISVVLFVLLRFLFILFALLHFGMTTRSSLEIIHDGPF